MDFILSENLLNQLQQELQGYKVIQSLREGSTRTGVFKLEVQGEFYYLKIFQRRNRFEPEVYAYRNWMSVIKPKCPELVTVLDDRSSSTFGFVITDLDGEVMKDCDLTEDQKAVCYHEAGELTRKLHSSFTGEYFGIPDLDGNPIDANWATAIEYYIEQLSGFTNEIKQMNRFDAVLKELYSWAMNNVDILTDEKAVPVSYDSTPGNWIVGANGEFRGFIDFENMLWA